MFLGLFGVGVCARAFPAMSCARWFMALRNDVTSSAADSTSTATVWNIARLMLSSIAFRSMPYRRTSPACANGSTWTRRFARTDPFPESLSPMTSRWRSHQSMYTGWPLVSMARQMSSKVEAGRRPSHRPANRSPMTTSFWCAAPT